MNYKAVEVKADPAWHEQLIATLFDIGFESFEESDQSLTAYIPDSRLDRQLLETTITELSSRISLPGLSYQIRNLEDKNWNEEWEQNFDPVIIDDKVLIKASFHKINKAYPYEILINPKMSFGTGHHETTSLMISFMLKYELKQKSVLDVGTGTGVLAIMAKLMSAGYVLTTDIDDWCINNSKENYQLNGFPHMEVLKGTITQLNINQSFDVVLANINKNVLLNEILHYGMLMKPGALLILSGFYANDQRDIQDICEHNNLNFIQSGYNKHWACLIFKKG